MGYVQGISREQALLFPEVIDEYLEEDNPVRFIDAYVDQLALAELGFERWDPAETGRPPYDPRDLLKLYIYGYLNRVRSSRRLERECGRNVEVMWLLRKLRPDFKTIADFRKDNRNAFKRVFRDFTQLCAHLDLFGKELVAIDGSKFKAVNSKKRNFTASLLARKLKEADERLEQYLQQLDEADASERDEQRPTVEALREKIEHLKAKRASYQALNQKLEASGASQISLTDPDSRSFPKKFGTDVGYNAQIAVDARHHLIIEQEVTNAVTDIDQLSPMAVQAKAALGVEALTVVADSGYCNAKEVERCEEAGIEAHTSRIPTSRNRKAGLYSKEMFRYDAKDDSYTCPAGQKLTYRFSGHEGRRHTRRWVLYYIGVGCQTCAQRHLCTRSKGPRRITRCPEDAAIERMQQRVAQHPELLAKRKQIVEHPFGTIKFWNGQDHFLTRGLEKVKAEFSLSALAYNIKRAIQILGVRTLVQALA